MATRIRLRRVGRKKLPLYRIVVADQEAPRDGRFIEIIGTYNPKGETPRTRSGRRRQGAALDLQGRDAVGTVQSLLKQAGVFQADRGRCWRPRRHVVVGRLRKPHGLKGDCTSSPSPTTRPPSSR